MGEGEDSEFGKPPGLPIDVGVFDAVCVVYRVHHGIGALVLSSLVPPPSALCSIS